MNGVPDAAKGGIGSDTILTLLEIQSKTVQTKNKKITTTDNQETSLKLKKMSASHSINIYNI